MSYMSTITLNPGQLEASRHFDGSMMVLAGPGSGKTTVITHRIMNLIKLYNVNPSEILVITFTKAATEEMRKRFLTLCDDGGRVSFSTFHSLFYRILKERRGYGLDDILKDDERRAAIKNILYGCGLGCEDDFLQAVSNEISLIKNELIDVRYYNSINLGSSDFLKVYDMYKQYKKQERKIDFDDMLTGCYHLLRKDAHVLDSCRNRYRYILIDEFQDINNAQYQCVKLLAEPLYNLFIVGDDDQSIYRFRGAKPEFLLRFPNDYPDVKKVLLDINYRSTDQIISLCNKIIASNKIRYNKKITGSGKSGRSPVLIKSADVGAEAQSISTTIKSLERNGHSLGEIAVIYRTNIQARAFIDAFMNNNLTYQVRDEMPGIYEHWIAKDVCSYMRLSGDRADDESLKRIINKPTRYISKAALLSAKKAGDSLLNYLYSGRVLQIWQLQRIEELMFYLNSLKKRNAHDAVKYIRQAVGYDDYIKSYSDYRKMKPSGLYEVLDELQEAAKSYDSIEDYLQHVEAVVTENKSKRVNRTNTEPKGITLTTMHSAKGLEFETVFITGAVEGIIPHEKSRTEAEIEEERRLLYVGMTRAKANLYISIINERYEQEVKPSRFLQNILREKS